MALTLIIKRLSSIFPGLVIVYRLPFFYHLMSVCLISVRLIAGVTDFLGKAEKSEGHVTGGQD